MVARADLKFVDWFSSQCRHDAMFGFMLIGFAFLAVLVYSVHVILSILSFFAIGMWIRWEYLRAKRNITGVIEVNR